MLIATEFWNKILKHILNLEELSFILGPTLS
jgi:hypothetical protein